MPEIETETTEPTLAVHHCGNTYKACCLPWGWCHCICGDCRVAKYESLNTRHKKRQAGDAIDGR